MTCGCRIKVDHLNPENYFVAELLRCPLHEAAGEMLKALKMFEGVKAWAEQWKDPRRNVILECCDWSILEAAIAKAERKVTEK